MFLVWTAEQIWSEKWQRYFPGTSSSNVSQCTRKEKLAGLSVASHSPACASALVQVGSCVTYNIKNSCQDGWRVQHAVIE